MKPDCKSCSKLMRIYNIKKQEKVRSSCPLCKCGIYADKKKKESVVLSILEEFASGRATGVPVNPREVAGLVDTPKNKTALAQCVRATGLTKKDLPPDIIEEAVHQTVVLATGWYNQRNDQTKERFRQNDWKNPPQIRFDYYEWMGIEKPREEIRMPSSWQREEEEMEGLHQHRLARGTKRLEVESNHADIKVAMTQGEGGGKRYSLFGYPVTAVLRWMGQDAWTFEDSKKAMSALHLPVNESTLRAQLIAGRNGERGAPADLTDTQIDQLYKLLDRPKPTLATKRKGQK